MLFASRRYKKILTERLCKAFPAEYREDVITVAEQLPAPVFSWRSPSAYKQWLTDVVTCWTLPSGERVEIPYRIEPMSMAAHAEKTLTDTQRLIYHCILSRSCDGYARQRHLEALLATETPEWVMPFILGLSQDYVAEIIEVIYTALQGRDNKDFQAFCRLNYTTFHKGYDRMLSYWAEYYRWYDPRTGQYYKTRYRDYVGWKLYAEVFGCKK